VLGFITVASRSCVVHDGQHHHGLARDNERLLVAPDGLPDLVNIEVSAAEVVEDHSLNSTVTNFAANDKRLLVGPDRLLDLV